MTPKISVIIPVYNTGNALKRCMKSIINQSFTDFECLLIDDGSTDVFTINLCLFYQKKDKRVKYLKKENEGIERTRVYGIGQAKGDYIIFSDHDDYYQLNAFQILYENAIVNADIDIVVANCWKKYNYIPIRKKQLGIYEKKIVDNQDFLNNFYCNFFGCNKFGVSTWGKLYRRSLFENIKFEYLGYNTIEDVILNLQIFPIARKVLFIPNLVYTHVYGGLTSLFRDTENGLKCYISALDFRTKYLDKYKLFDRYGKYLYIELKNILIHVIQKGIESKTCTKEEMIRILKNFKNTNQFEKLSLFYAGSNSIITKMENEEFEDLYLEFFQLTKKRRFITMIKTALKSFLR